jgi:tetratricopeptide (TPR) repeat protein
VSTAHTQTVGSNYHMKRLFIPFILIFVIISCKKKSPELIQVNEDPRISYYLEDDNLQIYFSEFEFENQGKLNNEGMNQGIKGNYEEAERILMNELSIDTTNSVVLNNLGNIKKSQGKYTEAKDYYEFSFKASDSTYFPAAWNLGTLYMENEKMQKAEEIYLYFANTSSIDFLVGFSNFLLAKMYCNGGWVEKAKPRIEMAKKSLMKYQDFHDVISEVESCIENYED